MGIRILYDPLEEVALLYQSVVELPISPLIRGMDSLDPYEIAEVFLEWLEKQEHYRCYMAERGLPWVAEKWNEFVNCDSGLEARTEYYERIYE